MCLNRLGFKSMGRLDDVSTLGPHCLTTNETIFKNTFVVHTCLTFLSYFVRPNLGRISERLVGAYWAHECFIDVRMGA